MLNQFIAFFSRSLWLRGSLPNAILLAGLLLVAGIPAHGLTVLPRTFDELVQLADAIMVGTVQEVHSGFADNGLSQNILSYVDFGDLQIIKGQVSTPTYTLQVPGGVVGRFAQDYPGIPQFQAGQRYVVFIRGNQRDFFPVVGITQGVFRVLKDGQGKQVVVRDDIAAQTSGLRSLSSVTRTAPSLDTFEQEIKDRLPNARSVSP